MSSSEKNEKKKEKMKKIEEQIQTAIKYAKRMKIKHQRFEEVQEPTRCSKCGKIITGFRYSTLPFKKAICPDCSREKTEKREPSKIKTLETERSKTKHKKPISRKKTYEIIRTESGIKVRKKEIEKDEQE